MSEQNIFMKFAKELERSIRPRCFPLAVKLLENQRDIPKDAIRPKKDLGAQLSLCQAFGKSRREGEVIALLKEDMWCPEPIICYGLVEPPQYFLDGNMNFLEEEKVRYVKNQEAAKNFGLLLSRRTALRKPPHRHPESRQITAPCSCSPSVDQCPKTIRQSFRSSLVGKLNQGL